MDLVQQWINSLLTVGLVCFCLPGLDFLQPGATTSTVFYRFSANSCNYQVFSPGD